MSRAGRAALRAAGCAAVLLAAAACPGQSAPVAQSDDGAAALRKVVAAEKSLVYTGYKRSIHGEEGEGRATRMKVSRSANGRTLLEWAREHGEPSHRWEYKSRFAWLDDPELLLRNYTVSVDPADGPPVAWRDTRHLVVRAKRPGRPSLELLVDKETSLVLREQIRDFDGKLWLTNVFDTIEYRAPDEAAAGATAAEPLTAAGVAAAPAVSLPLGVTAAPEGFVRASAELTARGAQREDWTDGLAAFSVIEYENQPGEAGSKEGELQRRACPGRASVSGVFSGIAVTVAGNLPATELESVVRGLAAVKQ